MTQAKIPFVIFFLERSGSSHLCSLLDSHPQISCGAEEFTTRRAPNTPAHSAPRYIHARKSRILDPDTNQTLQHLQRIFSRNERAAGFKLKYPIQVNRYPEIFKQLFEQKDSIRAIHLDRENVLKKYVSKQVLVQQRNDNDGFRRDEKWGFEPIQIELEGILDTLNRFENQRTELQKLVAPFEYRFDLEYEQLNSNETDSVGRLLEFLNVDPMQNLKSKFEKKLPPTIKESVTNVLELEKVVRGTKFEAMLY